MLLILAIIAIILALICYTFGVWGEKLSGRLDKTNLAFFWIGLVFDTSGTTMMSILSDKLEFNVHGVTGLLAILLMLFHAVWATIVFAKKDEKLMVKFHTFSLVVWAIWLIPFITGIVMNMI
ncbi:HsmA family protein [Brassicibacter mesophilus]|uniref:HsmA family protein n=1 Tax=Brassicibacter mesophilus TaxID=745119 RepID=UPI003D22E18C